MKRLANKFFWLILLFFGFFFSELFGYLWSLRRGQEIYSDLKKNWFQITSSPQSYEKSLAEILISFEDSSVRQSLFWLFPKWKNWFFLNFGRNGFILQKSSWLPFRNRPFVHLEKGLSVQHLLERVDIREEKFHPLLFKYFQRLRQEDPDWEKAYQILESGGPSCFLNSPYGLNCEKKKEKFPLGHERRLGCYPVGVRKPAQLEVFETQKEKCLFWSDFQSQSFDYPLKSQIHCLNFNQDEILTLPFDRVQAIFPHPVKKSFFLYEGQFAPPRVRSLQFGQGLSYERSVPQEEPISSGLFSFSGLPYHALPVKSYAIYRCEHEMDDLSYSSWIFAPRKFLLSTNLERDFGDEQFGVAFFSGNGFALHLLDFQKLTSIYPELETSFLDCIFAPSMDASCALTVLNRSAHLIWDLTHHRKLLSGLSHRVLSSLVFLNLVFLEKVKRFLPHWEYEDQTQLLFDFLRGLITEKQDIFLKTLYSLLPESSSVESFENFKQKENTWGLPQSFWRTLKKKHKLQGQSFKN